MTDLISRQAAYETLTEYYHHRTEIQHEALKEALDRVPSAEKKGKWKEIDLIGYKAICSECGVWSPVMGKYCPNCGARMDRSEDV